MMMSVFLLHGTVMVAGMFRATRGAENTVCWHTTEECLPLHLFVYMLCTCRTLHGCHVHIHTASSWLPSVGS